MTPQVPPPAGGPWRAPRRWEPVPGTPFAVAYLDVPKRTSGQAIGALVAGIAGLLVMVLVVCFGALAASSGLGAQVGGAFAILATLLGLAGVGLGGYGLRQTRRSGVPGKGMAIAGLSCGGAAVAGTIVTMAVLLVSG